MLRSLAVSLVIMSTLGIPAGAQTPTPLSVEAKIVDFAFQPATLTIEAGATVKWTNGGEAPHVVTDRGGAFDTKPILPKRSGTVTFTVPGTYSYFCRVHPGRMEATVEVKGLGEQARVNRIEADEFRFMPSELTVATGSLLLMANVGGLPHTITAQDNSFDTGVVIPGPQRGRFAGRNTSITLTTPGKYPFVCTVHPDSMKGVLTVSGPLRESAAKGSSAPNKIDVGMVDFAFRPPETSVAPAGEVTWRNQGAAPHTATFDDVSLGTDEIKPGSSGRLKAPMQPGSYAYRCAIHPTKMRGVLVVVGANMGDPTGRGGSQSAIVSNGIALSTLALSTGVVAAFVGGLGLAAFFGAFGIGAFARKGKRTRKGKG